MLNGTYSVSYDFNYRNPSSQSRIILVGTAHVSEKSVGEVNAVIEREKPDIVAVELDKGRFQALKGENEVKEINVRELLSGGKFYEFLLHSLLAFVQRKIGEDTGVKPGSDMIAAIDIAEKNKARVALIDRDIRITLGRFWNKMSFFEKLKLFGSLVGATVGMENLMDISKEGTVVAVIGAGHREGIQKYLDAPETIPPIEEMMALPKKRFNWLKAATIALVAMAVGLLALLVFSGGVSLEILLTALLWLFITQGILSAIGVLIARGHPLSALTAFSLAWFGFLHPFLAIGWLAGIVEAYFRPPTTQDIKMIMKAGTIKELMNIKLFRIVLVAGFANIGSMIGTFVAIPIMVHYLGITNPLDILRTALDTGFNAIRNILKVP
ncbi:MAG: TraB/GumN family protein [Candidatus Methanoperedens sp.]|nr:TraB/GumN family protein [Candidatus Methanoperedens sp.]